MPPARTPSSQFTRSTNACESCRRRKVKCSGEQPCQTCARQGLECRFGLIARRGYSEPYVQRLLDTIKRQEEQLRLIPADESPDGNTSASAGGNLSSPSDARDQETWQASTMPAEPLTGNDTSTSLGNDLPFSPTATDLASGPAFESKVRSIMRNHGGHAPSITSEGPEDQSSINWRPSTDLVEVSSAPELLSKKESYRLFDLFVSLMGTTQHFIDPRTFGDQIDLLYHNEFTRAAQMRTTWFTEYLIVIALALTMASPSEKSDNPPGSAYFAEAMRRLPPLHQLGSHGIIAVEILCLTGLYLLWCDRKHDAYLYIGSAVRLAIALGAALPREEQPGVSSEKCHRTRVWWTAYMLDRRLSAGLGLPMGADERQLRTDLPKPAVGFQPPQPLIVNIQIARATGEITTTFYGNRSITQSELVQRIQSTLQGLYETGRSIPNYLHIDFETPNVTVTRTSASLYLMLFQAIILCIRPIILQGVKDKVQSSIENRPQSTKSPVVARLWGSCREAAIKSIRILTSLRKDEGIALFGYFDLDATFSAAFILVMMGFVDTSDLQKPPEGVSQAAGVLQYLADAGNSAAQRRLDELKHFCRRVWSPPSDTTVEWAWLRSGSQDAAAMTVATMGITPPPVYEASNLSAQQQQSSTSGNLQAGLQESWRNQTEHDQHADLDNFLNDLPMDLGAEMGGIYSSYNDPSLPLTGIDDVDWAQVGKMFSL